MTNRILLAIIALLIGLALGLVLHPVHAKEPNLPYTTPKISYQHTTVRISWYNTTPKVYTIAERLDTCNIRYCILSIRIRYKKFIPIGNVRIDVKRARGQIIIY